MPRPGFTLPETLVTMAVGSMVLLIVVGFMIEANRFQQFIAEQSTAITVADSATTTMAKALRETIDGANGSYALDTAEDNTVIFYSDIDADSNTEQVTYTLSGTQINQTTIEPTTAPSQYLSQNGTTKTVATNIVNGTYTHNAIFTYYDDQNQVLPTPVDLSSVTLVRIHLDVNVDPNRVPDTHTIETYVQLRNLNDNL
jgi:prepilin-type N-terminal cleavage/methylation domain-containing protein